MIDETTWHRDPALKKNFVWSETSGGIQLHHTNKKGSYVIPWSVFFAVVQQARNNGNNVVTAGTSQTNPTQGSVGEWVSTENLPLSMGKLTPRHLSFIGPILGRMGFISCQLNGNSIQWVFRCAKFKK